MVHDGPTPGADRVDGRRARGERRRAEIITAALAVVTREGAGGLTHRTVAREAGITTSLTTYYFATLDDLMVAALTSVADVYTARVRGILDGGGDPLTGLAELIAETAGPGRDRALAERELATLAARRPALRPVARRWREDVAALGARLTDDPCSVTALVSTADGLCTSVLLENGPAESDHLRAVLARAVGR